MRSLNKGQPYEVLTEVLTEVLILVGAPKMSAQRDHAFLIETLKNVTKVVYLKLGTIFGFEFTETSITPNQLSFIGLTTPTPYLSPRLRTKNNNNFF